MGFATNSSSTHSLVFMRGAQDYGVEDNEFGWDRFTAASERAKRDYLALLLNGALRQLVHEDIAAAVVRDWCAGSSYATGDKTLDGLDGGYIDHQSVMVLPQTWDGKGVDRQFFADLSTFLLRDDVAILGGNDNDDEAHHLGPGFELPIERDGRSALVARKDDVLGHWTVFSRENGSKVRFSFDEAGCCGTTPTKASSPELVDVKITDYCPMDCAYCYQGSTTAGAHADLSTLEGIAGALAKMRVFEVAIGGGEPTMHPKFADVLKAFRSRGVVPNFTTKSLAWLKDSTIRSALSCVGGFAYSAETAADVEKFVRATADVDGLPSRGIQHVMGSVPEEEFERMVVACFGHGVQLVLLGYKTTGRGADVAPHGYDNWPQIVKRASRRRWLRVGIDTALAREMHAKGMDSEALRGVAANSSNVRGLLYGTDEGKFSMYIDAVTKRMGPSSYCESLLMRPLPERLSEWSGHEKVAEAFSRW